MDAASKVTIKLEGVDHDLVCTLESCQKVSSHFGGVANAFQGVKNLDISAMAVVIEAGLGDKAKEFDDIPLSIFKTGLVNLANDVSAFIMLISMGGQTPDDTETEVKDKGEGKS